MTICNHCGGTGFVNADQFPEGLLGMLDAYDALEWLLLMGKWPHDIAVCDCCGDGEIWYGEPGRHYTTFDPQGPGGPYASNGGLCKCHRVERGSSLTPRAECE